MRYTDWKPSCRLLFQFGQKAYRLQMRRIQNLLFLFRPILPDYISKLIRMNRLHTLLFHPFHAICDSLLLFSRLRLGQCQLPQRLQRKFFVVPSKVSVFLFYFPFFTHEVQSFLLCIPILFHISRSFFADSSIHACLFRSLLLRFVSVP